ncbi:MAG: lipase family protein [Rhodococcus sp. (in: high G+C Gram-positive bacteria)]|uniref:lipase family protein n=1 Tax=Nocardiaceae TaxID=85025 RepID=UPI001E554922|nr:MULTISPECIES: lipase family protein [Rhodococcus]MCZ4274927.1 lipase family protein [Rhodococcus yunnanensis]
MQALTRGRSRGTTTAVASASVVICAALGACATDTTAPAYSTSPPTATDEAVAARGSIVSTSTDTEFDPNDFPDGTVAATFVYNSISGVTGESTKVTGALFVPGDPAPAEGHHVVAYAHGTVGITPGCAPTESSELAGDAGAVSFLLQQGYAVVYTDYQGLSSSVDSPPHPYLEPRTAGFNVIDSIRGARNLDPSLSTRWVAAGTSQGGHAAWAANEYNDLYGDGLELLGTAVLAPALDVSPVVALAQTSTLSGGQQALYPVIVEGAAAVDPSIEPSEHLHGLLGERSAELGSCGPEGIAARSAVAGRIDAGDTTATDTEAAGQLTMRLQDYALPKAPSSAPILAVYGDADDIVRPAWTEDALGRACELGDTVLRVELEGQGHSVDPGPLLENWIADRFAGAPSPNNC